MTEERISRLNLQIKEVINVMKRLGKGTVKELSGMKGKCHGSGLSAS